MKKVNLNKKQTLKIKKVNGTKNEVNGKGFVLCGQTMFVLGMMEFVIQNITKAFKNYLI